MGRFLEHARIYTFENDGNPEVYASSADLMSRNLFKRVEICFPIENKKLSQRIIRNLEWYLSDNSQAWILQSDGSYNRVTRAEDEEIIQAQSMLLADAQTI